MRIRRPGLAYVTHSLDPGGTERLVIEMGLALADEFDLIVVCLDRLGLWANRLLDYGIPVYSVNRRPGLDLDVPKRLAYIFRKHQTQIVHAHQCTPWFYSALSRLINPAQKLVFTEHGRFFPETKNHKKILVNKLLIEPFTSRIIAVSEDIKKRLCVYEGLRYKSIDIIYNGALINSSCNISKSSIRQNFGFTDNDFIVGSVGRLDPIKNIPLLIGALYKIAQQKLPVYGLLIGDGPEFNYISAMINDLGLKDKIIMTGFREDAQNLLRALDLFVLPSFSEGISLALLEAIMAGIPVVATDVGGNPEVIINNYTGWVIPSNSTDTLVTAIIEAINNPYKLHMFSTSAYNIVQNKFNFSTMLDKYRIVYSKILIDKKFNLH